jgi:hypothetical protein
LFRPKYWADRRPGAPRRQASRTGAMRRSMATSA